MPSDSAAISGQQEKPKRKRRWFQFSLRSLFVMMLLLSVGLRWMAAKVETQKVAVKATLKDGGSVWYDYEVDASGSIVAGAEPPGPNWLRKMLGDDAFTNVVKADVTTDVSLEKLSELGRIRFLTNRLYPPLSWYPFHNVGSPRITDAGLVHIWRLSRLIALDLCGAEITDVGMAHLAELTQLNELCLSNTHVTDAGLEYVRGFNQLSRLELDGTKVSGAGLEHIKGLSRLRILGLASTKVTDAGIAHLSGLTQLRMLGLGNTLVTDAGLAHLKGLSQLIIVDFTGTKVTPAGAKDLKKALPNCTVLAP
ncbi:MAG TPA: hypothetical protein VG056_17510 [Pirellulales bacterium]|jgi:Leucine-rich repeat (LRR) protein|nr:hypothetical protein [Pirellulales bacterium]